MNILFVDKDNSNISRTAEIAFSNNYRDHRFRSAGIYSHYVDKNGGVLLQEYMLKQADYIVCFDEKIEEWILRMYQKNLDTKIKVLHISGEFDYMCESLIFKLEEACQSLSL